MFVAMLICIASFFPIGEKDMLEPDERWENRKRIDNNDSLWFAVLRNMGYADSSGKLNSKISLWLLEECPGDSTYSLFLVNGTESQRDDAIWLVLRHRNEILARSMVAALETNCESTFLRVSYMSDSNVVEMPQLNHVFSCETDAYIRTDTLVSARLRVYDNRIEDISE